MSKDEAIHAMSNPNRRASQDGVSEQMRERIETRAYELFLERGCEHGHDVEDWTKAESEIVHQSKLHHAA